MSLLSQCHRCADDFAVGQCYIYPVRHKCRSSDCMLSSQARLTVPDCGPMCAVVERMKALGAKSVTFLAEAHTRELVVYTSTDSASIKTFFRGLMHDDASDIAVESGEACVACKKSERCDLLWRGMYWSLCALLRFTHILTRIAIYLRSQHGPRRALR